MTIVVPLNMAVSTLDIAAPPLNIAIAITPPLNITPPPPLKIMIIKR